jgi:predicted amidohydrolase
MEAVRVAVWNREVPHEGFMPADLRLESLEKLLGVKGDPPLLVVLPPRSCRLSPSSQAIPRLNSLEQLLAPWCELARYLGVNLIPGSFLVHHQESLKTEESQLHLAPFIDNKGQLTGVSAQTHLSPQERDDGWQAGRELPLVDTAIGRVAILLNQDCRQPEAWRLTTLAGAELVVSLTMVPKPYTEPKQLAGSWQNVQQNQVLGVECSFEGQWQGKSYQGRNAYLAPCEMTPGFTGFLKGEEQGGWLVKELYFEPLHQVRQEYPLLKQLNLIMYEHRLLPLYRRWQEEKR